MENLFLAFLNMSLTASYVILFIILVRLPLKKMPRIISYALWSVAAFRLVCPFSFDSMLSLLPPMDSVPIPQDIAYRQGPQISSAVTSVDMYVNSSLPVPVMEGSANSLQIYTRTGACIWLLGIAAMLVYSIFSVLVLKNRLKGARNTALNIYEADNLKTPFVLGALRPRIFIPSGLPEEEKSYIIRHEQTHIGRLDHIIKPLAFFILSMHWFNPLVWIAFILMSTDMELSCDERVIKEMGGKIKKAYSASLLSLASGKHIINGSPLAFGEGNIRGRIKNVLNYKKPALWVVAAAAIAVAGVGIGLAANPKQQKPGVDNTGRGASIKYIQIEITDPGSKVITGRVITDKDGYNAGDTVSAAVGENVTYDVDSLVAGDWIDVGYYIVMEKHPPEFAAHSLSRLTGSNYPTAFTLFEDNKVIRANTLQNSRIASEMPSLILSGRAAGRPSISDVPDSSGYLKIDIGAGEEKIYYAFEKDGKCYIEKPYDTVYEISRETFGELLQYVYKNEITHGRAAERTTPEPAAPGWSPGQSIDTADMAELDYASDDIVIFHGHFGLFVYDLNSRQIIRSLDLKPLNCAATQGDDYCDVTVSEDGNTVQLHRMSSDSMYVYTVSDNALRETVFEPMSNRFGSRFVPTEELHGPEEIAHYSHNAVRFDTGEYGLLYTDDWTLGTLSYSRGDMVYALFDIKES